MSFTKEEAVKLDCIREKRFSLFEGLDSLLGLKTPKTMDWYPTYTNYEEFIPNRYPALTPCYSRQFEQEGKLTRNFQALNVVTMDLNQTNHFEREETPMERKLEKAQAWGQKFFNVEYSPASPLFRGNQSCERNFLLAQGASRLSNFVESLPATTSLKQEHSVQTNVVEHREVVDEQRYISSSIALDGKPGQRLNSWTNQEEVFLIGVVVTKYLTHGTLFANETSRKKRKLTGSKSISVVDECWRSIREAFDLVWRNYSKKSGQLRPCDRTAKALARHYKVMKTKLNSGNQAKFHSLHGQWQKQNFDHSLLNPDYFAIKEFLEERKRLEKHSAMNLGSVGVSHRRTQSSLSQMSLVSTQSNMSRKRSVESVQTENLSLSSSWPVFEEIILVGIVMERFIERGSLVAPRGKRTDQNVNEQDCWTKLKSTFDLTVEKYSQLTGKSYWPVQRTPNSLSRQYKLIRQRNTKGTRDQIEELEGKGCKVSVEQNIRSENTQYGLSLWQLFEKWNYELNNNEQLLAH
eukprot:snap_masked-scaffold_3-processed-gene-8.22-mRNA-1 protein AED:1.00 eAED:1.00 QI:0/-1/0/0/-1/1/1/0/519